MIVNAESESIDNIYDNKNIAAKSVLQVDIKNIQVIPNTTTYLVTVGNDKSFKRIDWYLHQKFYKLVNTTPPILASGTHLRMTGCRVVPTSNSPSQLRLLPTEYVVVTLHENEVAKILSQYEQILLSDFIANCNAPMKLSNCILVLKVLFILLNK